VVVDSPRAFAAWQAQQSSFGQILAETPPAAMSILLIKANACSVPASWSIR